MATIFCCIVTCVVTSILTISYKNVVLKQTCILNLDIKNIGSAAIENGDITLKTSEDIPKSKFTF